MPRIIIKLNNVSKKKIDDFIETAGNFIDTDLEIFKNNYYNYIIDEYKTLKEYAENIVIDAYINASKDVLYKITNKKWLDDYFDVISSKARYEIAVYYTGNKNYDDIIDIYFNEVKREYILHPMNESDKLEFLPENRDIFIKNNLKLVVNCAKRYRFLGVPFEDLIQAGNIGLLEAFNRFDTSKAKVRDEIISLINLSELNSFTKEEAQKILLTKLTYGKNIEVVYNKVPEFGFSTKQEFIDWTKINIKTAVFASVAFQWIKGAVLTSIANSNQVKVPYNKLATGYTNFLSIDQMSPQTHDDNGEIITTYASDDHFLIDAEDIEKSQEIKKYKDTVNELLTCLDDTERRLIKKRYGIGLPDALSYIEIGKQEGISSVAVRKIINGALEKLMNNIQEDKRKELINILFN